MTIKEAIIHANDLVNDAFSVQKIRQGKEMINNIRILLQEEKQLHDAYEHRIDLPWFVFNAGNQVEDKKTTRLNPTDVERIKRMKKQTPVIADETAVDLFTPPKRSSKKK